MTPRILLVNDDRLLREVIGDFLRSRGCEVDVVINREETQALLRSAKYGLALIDSNSRCNGIKLRREIRPADPSLTCLVINSYAIEKTVAAATGKGEPNYILKPCQLEELTILLEKSL